MNPTIRRLLDARQELLNSIYWMDFPDAAVIRALNTLTDIATEMGWSNPDRVGTEENGCIITHMEAPTSYRIYDLGNEDEYFFNSLEEMDFYIQNGCELGDEDDD